MILLKNVLVATDFSDASSTGLNYGRALAGRFGATLHVLHVADKVSVHREAEEAARKQLQGLLTDDDRTELHAKPVVVTSAPALAIIDYAKNANIDLIIVGTHSRSGVKHLFIGSVAEQITRAAPCPVLVVRHPEHEFVVPDPPTNR